MALFVFSCLFIDSSGCVMSQAYNFRPFIAEAWLRFRFDHRSQVITDKEHRRIRHVLGVALVALYQSVSGADSCKNLVMDKGHKSIPDCRAL